MSLKADKCLYPFWIDTGQLPHPGDNGVTELATSIFYIKDQDIVTQPFNEQFAAVVAVGVVSWMARDIPYIDVMNALCHCDLPEFSKCSG